MPIYEYQCEKCRRIFERLVYSSEDNEQIVCPKCGAKQVKRVLSTTGILGSSCAGATSGFS
ncbi:MAG: zinc ribbon domain-containing protein [Pseudomonadota bacterium]|jgi:putative FmdB family regulatory protein